MLDSLIDAFVRPAFWIPSLVLVVGAYFAVRFSHKKSLAGYSSINKFKPKMEVKSADTPQVTFADVAGLDEVVDELREVRDYLSDPKRFNNLGAELPKGILLYGPSGSGKTLLAKALAGEGNVPFFSVSAASFVEVYVGVGASRVRTLFEEAKKSAPAIVFIDELDAVGKRRNAEAPGEREYDQTLNQLLIELDGFGGASGVLLIGATNRPEMIDPALLRPGRFDRRIHVGGPDLAGREKILKLHASKRPYSTSVDWRMVAQRTAGLMGADLANIINEASFLAARKHKQSITTEEVEEAMDRHISGPRSGRSMSNEERRLIAYHEAGHALLSLLLDGVRPVNRISIVGRIGDASKSMWAQSEDGEVTTRRQLMARLMVLLAGRAAEKYMFGEPSTRAEDDLREAGQLARRMVERWAMTGAFEFSANESGRGMYAEPDKSANQEIRKLLVKSEDGAMRIIEEYEDALRGIAEALIQRETLNVDEIAYVAGLDDLDIRTGDDDLLPSPPRELFPQGERQGIGRQSF